ncbi:alanine racemase [Ancylothrix sp. C2]|uniref:alanine racemase n=1 Tax=Ancylothrix sp. D3o TaxID=2953691 RepID=UPI0021BB50F9|nr:alanine racemase [Ancylothrix sp. D3o]MCT7949893.1 alanine racemase [Ancylothrix sp. D3o]
MLSWEQSPSLASMRCERAWVEINLPALAENVRYLKRLLSPKTDLMAVIKADAYGHGAVQVAQTVLNSGADWLGVATIPEGIELRESGITAPILILGATNTTEQVRTLVRWQLQPTLCTPQQALIFSEALQSLSFAKGKEQTLPVHIKLDTGMSRLGSPWQEATEFVKCVSACPNLKIASIYSHFATADSPDPTIMWQQHSRFQKAIFALQNAGLSVPKLHLSNSAAALTDSHLHYDMVRMGLAIYGLYPAEHLKSVVELKPVMQVKARVTQIKTLEAGTGVSYGHHFVASRSMRVAVIGIGYADGIPRNLSNKMKVLVRGEWVQQIGAITMDQLMLDVTAIPDLQVGEVVTLLGSQGKHHISAEDWATMLGTISWEILCGFKHRLPRVPVSQPFELQQQPVQP